MTRQSAISTGSHNTIELSGRHSAIELRYDDSVGGDDERLWEFDDSELESGHAVGIVDERPYAVVVLEELNRCRRGRRVCDRDDRRVAGFSVLLLELRKLWMLLPTWGTPRSEEVHDHIPPAMSVETELAAKEGSSFHWRSDPSDDPRRLLIFVADAGREDGHEDRKDHEHQASHRGCRPSTRRSDALHASVRVCARHPEKRREVPQPSTIRAQRRSAAPQRSAPKLVNPVGRTDQPAIRCAEQGRPGERLPTAATGTAANNRQAGRHGCSSCRPPA